MLKQFLEKQLASNKNADEIKQSIRLKLARVQNITFHHFASDQQQFMEYLARVSVQPEDLSLLDSLTRERHQNVAESIEKGQIWLAVDQNETTVVAKPSSPPIQSQTLTIELRGREEYPISANYDYWSTKHSKSIETRQYMKQLHEQDRKVKEELRGKKMAIEEAKRQKAEAKRQEQQLLENQRKEQIKDQAIAKINLIKQQQEDRIQRESEFKQFLKEYKAKEPLHVKVQQQFHQKIELPLLEERKLKLQKLRSIRKPSLEEIEEHARKHDEEMSQRNRSPIANEPIKVSYRSKFHSSFDIEPSNTTKDLYDKKNQYGKMVKEEFKPVVSQRLVEEMQQRFEPKDPLSLRYKKNKGDGVEDDDDDDDDEPRRKDEPKSKEGQEGNGADDDEEYDEEAEDRAQEPQCAYRNKLGNQYLDFVRKLRKKPGPNLEERVKIADQIEQQQLQRQRQRVVRPNYIEDLRKMRSQSAANNNKTNPFQNWQSDLKNQNIDEVQKKRRMLIKSQRISELAQRKEFIISHNKLSQNQMLEEKKKVDSQLLDAIRAKLAVMQV